MDTTRRIALRRGGRAVITAAVAVMTVAAGSGIAAQARSGPGPTCDARVTIVALGAGGFPHLGPSHLYIVEDETELGRSTGHQLLYLETNGVKGLQRNDWMCLHPNSGNDFMLATTGHCEYTRDSGWPVPSCPV